jgi:soluble lytic murein transglycosylase-like protein
MLLRILVLVTGVVFFWPSQADAQIYAWRDANGNLVLSDRKVGVGSQTDVKTYAVPETPSFRSTKPVASRRIRQEFEPLVQEHARLQGVRADLVRAVIQVESGFNPRARSHVGAMGLMQLMPTTARELGVVNAYDPAENIRGGTMYLRQLLDKYDGNEELALAAYNAGSGAVDRHGRQVPPFRETKDYVKKVGSVASIETLPASVPASVGAPGAVSGKRVLYKTIDTVDGRAIIRYSTERPASGSFETVAF